MGQTGRFLPSLQHTPPHLVGTGSLIVWVGGGLIGVHLFDTVAQALVVNQSKVAAGIVLTKGR